MKLKHFYISLFLYINVFVGCTEVDCPINNAVLATYSFYDSQNQEPIAIDDTLLITFIHSQSPLIKGVGIKKLQLPLSTDEERDSLLFYWLNPENIAIVDTIVVEKNNEMHFESLSCPATFFHTIKGVKALVDSASWRPSLTIDSIVVKNPKVDYNEIEHFKIFVSRR